MDATKRITWATLAIFLAALGGAILFRSVSPVESFVIEASNHPVFGSAHAKIEVLVFEDFTCSTCRWFTEKVVPAIRESYLDPGIARLIVIPITLHSESRILANAALEVYHQAPQAFFAFLHELFVRFPEQDPNLEDLVKVASSIEEVALDLFRQNVQLGVYDADLENNFRFAKTIMRKTVRTPAVFINGVAVHGLTFAEVSAQIGALRGGALP